MFCNVFKHLQFLNKTFSRNHVLETTSTRTKHLTFGPWATLVLASLVPENGVFFREDISNYDDILTWWTFHYRDEVAIKDVSGFVTHYHKLNREGSLFDINQDDEKSIMLDLWKKKTAIHPVPGYPDKGEVQAESLKSIDLSYLLILRVYWQHL